MSHVHVRHLLYFMCCLLLCKSAHILPALNTLSVLRLVPPTGQVAASDLPGAMTGLSIISRVRSHAAAFLLAHKARLDQVHQEAASCHRPSPDCSQDEVHPDDVPYLAAGSRDYHPESCLGVAE
jgi:hypothetical protein